MSKRVVRRVRRGRAEWQRLIEEQAVSGQTQAAFCAARGIGVGSFQNWKRRLAGSAVQDSWVDLGPLGERLSSGWEIELDLGEGVCLRLRRC